MKKVHQNTGAFELVKCAFRTDPRSRSPERAENHSAPATIWLAKMSCISQTDTDPLRHVASPSNPSEDPNMAESVYKVIELVGTSSESWEKAASAAVKKASKTLRDLRVAEVSELDMVLNDGKVESYRAKLKVSFKYED